MSTEIVTISEILLVIVLLCMSVFFSGSETAYSSLSRTRLKALANEGDEKAELALSNIEPFDRFLTTILVGNNIVNIASSTIATALLSEAFGPELGVIYATILMITVLLLVGEITPKSIAKKNPEKFATKVAGGVHVSMVILSPISWFFMKVSNAISKLLKADGEAEPMSEEELTVMIDEVQKEGTLEKSEGDLVKSALEFDDIKVSDICIPRVDVKAVDVTVSVEELKDLFVEAELSRIPVYEGTIDKVIGAVFIKDFFAKIASGKPFNVTDIIRPIKFIAETTSVADAMRGLQKAKLQMAIVLDATGGTVGLVTMEDLLEELVGEIWDESDIVRLPLVKNPDGSWKVSADANIYDIMEQIGQDFDDGGYSDASVGGYIMYCLGRMPKVGDQVISGAVRMTVKIVRNRRVREVSFEIDPSLVQNEEEETRGNPSGLRRPPRVSRGWPPPCR